jgi:hypothetical protein
MTGHTTDGTLGGRTSRNRYLKQASEASPGYIRGDRLLVKTAQTAAMPPKKSLPGSLAPWHLAVTGPFKPNARLFTPRSTEPVR